MWHSLDFKWVRYDHKKTMSKIWPFEVGTSMLSPIVHPIPTVVKIVANNKPTLKVRQLNLMTSYIKPNIVVEIERREVVTCHTYSTLRANFLKPK